MLGRQSKTPSSWLVMLAVLAFIPALTAQAQFGSFVIMKMCYE
jgi:hypothetical protein